MAESDGSSWPTQNAQSNLQHQAHKFQALRDWNWFHSAPANPWLPNPGSTGGGAPAHVQHYAVGNRGQYGRQDNGQNQWRKRPKKQKEPEFSHFCDTCDRGFKNEHKYDEHIAQHVKCSFEDCKYTAHEKLVKIHWKNSHAPGAKRIKLDTADEIAKWREERRRNYPTQSNIQKKIQLIEFKEKRGDVLETPQFGRFKRRGRGFQPHRGNEQGGRQHNHTGSEKVKIRPPQNVDPLGALATSDPDSEKEESVQEMKAAVSVAPKNLTSALGSLICSYGEDMTESEEEGSPILQKSALALKENKALLSAHSASNHIAAQKTESRPTVKEPKISQQSASPQSQSHLQKSGARGRRRGKPNNDPRTENQKCHPTLLEMLLAPDIRHERNVLLQCIRYIVHKEFFGVARKDSNTAGPDVAAAAVHGSVSGNIGGNDVKT